MLIDFQKQFIDGAKAAKNIKASGQFNRVVFCGMGGSAIPGEMVSMLWLNKFNCYINHGFGLPDWVNKNCLIICVSWSGDTKETISSFEAAIEKDLPVVVVADRGKLLEMAKKHDKPFIDLPAADLPARFVAGQMLAAILTLLGNSTIIEYNLPSGADCQPIGSDFSSRINDKIPLIYSSYQWRYLARFWKIHFNENSKIHAFSNYFPEAAHNEISAFDKSNNDKFFPIILIDPQEEPADVEKLQKFSAFLKNQNTDYEVVEIVGKDRMEKIIKNYNYAITVSTGLAEIKNTDPFDAAVIEKFKKL